MSIKGLGFNKMTNRCLTRSDANKQTIEVKSHNVHIGNKAHWGSVHEGRFDIIDKDPEILSSTQL